MTHQQNDATRPSGPQALLTEKEAADLAKVSKWTIRRLIEAGRLRASNYGSARRKVYRIHPDDLRQVDLAEPVPDRRFNPHSGRARLQSNGPLRSGEKAWPPSDASTR